MWNRFGGIQFVSCPLGGRASISQDQNFISIHHTHKQHTPQCDLVRTRQNRTELCKAFEEHFDSINACPDHEILLYFDEAYLHPMVAIFSLSCNIVNLNILPQQHLAHTKEIFCKIRVNASTFTKLLIFFWIDEKGEGVSGRMVFLINLLSLTSQTWGVGCARALLIDFFFFVPLSSLRIHKNLDNNVFLTFSNLAA